MSDLEINSEDYGLRPRPIFGNSRTFFKPIISKLDKHVDNIRFAFLSQHNIGKECRQARVRESAQVSSLLFAQNATDQTPFDLGFSASLRILVLIRSSLISSKSVAPILGNLVEDSI